ncbi:MAG: UbiA prenyltransferase family protein [Bacteroidetes bacterium]|nr:UbiA prenyltransferase family protein [Bacteroidota bacterium]
MKYFSSIFLHLRIPFSFFLMPVYLFALAISPNFAESRLIWSFIIIHLLLYPASNAYNSYFDKDENSIGGLKNPPPVNKGLYFTSLGFDLLAIVLGYIQINALFAIMLLIYGVVSKAYSHPSIRLKKYPIAGWLTIGVFQGFFTFLMCYVGINGFELSNLAQAKVLIPALLTSIMLWGNYPMTQVYQHEEDTKHGDRTISLMLGIRGTFVFVQALFAVATICFVIYFNQFHTLQVAYAFLVALAPVVIFFMYWFYLVWKDSTQANFGYTMWLNFISSCCLNGFFAYLWVATSHLDQYF